MTYLLVAAVVLIWAMVLSPAGRRAREGRNVAGSGRSMRTLRSNHEVRRQGGRLVLVPYKPLGQRRNRSALRRRSF